MGEHPMSQLVNMVDWVRGYRVGPDALAMAYLSVEGRTGPMSTCEYVDSIGADPARAAAEMVGPGDLPAVEGFEHVVLIRREATPEETAAFFDAVDRELAAQPAAITPTVHVCVDRGGEIFMRAAEEGAAWESCGQLAEPDPQLAVMGYQQPAATREEFLAGLAPAEEPAFEALSADDRGRQFLESASPVQQAQMVRDYLDRLGSHHVQNQPQAQRWKQWVSHAMADSKVIRDVAMSHAARSDMGTETLTGIAREAPEKYRPYVASAAGCAIVLRGMGASRSDAMFDLAKVDGEELNAARLGRAVSRLGQSPEPLRQGIEAAMANDLAGAQRAWEAEQRLIESADWADPAQATGPWAVSTGPEVE